MTNTELLEMLSTVKIDLGITTTAYDDRLKQFILAAEAFIVEEGGTLNFTKEKDCHLVEMYAEWLWRKRDSGAGMPRMLRYALNNHILGEVARNG